MEDLQKTLKYLLPLDGYTDAAELEADVQAVMDAENPVSLDEQTRHREPSLLTMNIDEADDEELERAVMEWERVRDELSTMYRRRASYFEWEYRRAYVLELLAEIAEKQFGEASAERTERHRIAVEVNMWASFARHLLMEVQIDDVTSAEDDYGFLDIKTKHRINAAIMTTASILESVGEEILARSHNHTPSDHMSMADINDELRDYGHLADEEYRTVDEFRREIRNKIAHDILQRNFGNFDNFRQEVIRPCWRVIDLAEKLAEDEIAPDQS